MMCTLTAAADIARARWRRERAKASIAMHDDDYTLLISASPPQVAADDAGIEY